MTTLKDQTIIQQLRLRKEFLRSRVIDTAKDSTLDLAKRYLTKFYCVQQ